MCFLYSREEKKLVHSEAKPSTCPDITPHYEAAQSYPADVLTFYHQGREVNINKQTGNDFQCGRSTCWYLVRLLCSIRLTCPLCTFDERALQDQRQEDLRRHGDTASITDTGR
ncbi:hypothetical protein AK812_SmicGene21794 [Symbiodinium microadriaticum]|uniref:Uncharacterized protein n=1 Tax=Symbiodinium microadriaticum TaxID=2951 RepID=A0A1Q9DLI6_SYMMI|nr:hypothetical protein AK812_SmicGene21794 [Symbiodinium microadriaticum]